MIWRSRRVRPGWDRAFMVCYLYNEYATNITRSAGPVKGRRAGRRPGGRPAGNALTGGGCPSASCDNSPQTDGSSRVLDSSRADSPRLIGRERPRRPVHGSEAGAAVHGSPAAWLLPELRRYVRDRRNAQNQPYRRRVRPLGSVDHGWRRSSLRPGVSGIRGQGRGRGIVPRTSHLRGRRRHRHHRPVPLAARHHGESLWSRRVEGLAGGLVRGRSPRQPHRHQIRGGLRDQRRKSSLIQRVRPGSFTRVVVTKPGTAPPVRLMNSA